IGSREGGQSGVVEGLDWTRTDDRKVGDRSVLVNVERDDDMTSHAHRRIRDQPIALDLCDKAPDPRAKLDTFCIELNLRPELPTPIPRVIEHVALHEALQILERFAQAT